MFKWFKKKNTKINTGKNRYDTFDDFITLMLECSDEQFECTFNWFRRMRKRNIKF